MQGERSEWDIVREREKYLVKEICPLELSRRCVILTDEDREQITADNNNHGSTHATRTLLGRLRRRGPKAFPNFIHNLREEGFPHTAQILDPKYEIKGETSGSDSDRENLDMVCIDGDVTDLRVEVNVKGSQKCFIIENLLNGLYDDSKSEEVRALRKKFTEQLDEEMKRYVNFVKIIKTGTQPFVLVFRLSHLVAAERFWANFENGKLATIVRECFQTFPATKSLLEDTDVQIGVNINEDYRNTVIDTLRDSKRVAVIDGSERKEFSLKDYQNELAQPALQGKNTIICAPTGSGKTFVAMEVMKQHLSHEKNGKVIFVVNSVSLVQQQRQRFETYLPDGVMVSSLCGSSMDKLSTLLQNNDVIVVTGQILVNALKAREIIICDTTLLILDECHHTKGGTPYNEIMWWYRKTKYGGESTTSKLPQVLGLSASLGIGSGNSSCTDRAKIHILDICANIDAHVLKVSNADNQQTNTTVSTVLRETCGVFQTAINEAMSQVEKILKTSPGKNIDPAPFPRGCQHYENWIVNVQKFNLGQDLMTCAEHLNHYNNALVINNELRTQDALCYLEKLGRLEEDTETEQRLKHIYQNIVSSLAETIQKNGTWNLSWALKKLDGSLTKRFSENPSSKGIVFVRTRFLASALVDWIKESPHLGFIKPSHVIGCGQKDGKEGMTKVQQDEKIKKFDDGVCNLIVATSTLVEGIDIQGCNFVINYNMQGNEIMHVQARGRVRSEGDYEVIVAKELKQAKERDLEKEQVMMEAISGIRDMSIEEFHDEVERRQFKSYEERVRMQSGNKSALRPLVTEHVFLCCKKCDKIKCKAQVIKIYCKAHHLVINYKKSMEGIVFRQKNPENIGKDLLKIGHIFCEKCDQKLGIMSKNSYGEYPCLKICEFRVKNGPRDDGKVYKSWKDFPYALERFDATRQLKESSNGRTTLP